MKQCYDHFGDDQNELTCICFLDANKIVFKDDRMYTTFPLYEFMHGEFLKVNKKRK